MGGCEALPEGVLGSDPPGLALCGNPHPGGLTCAWNRSTLYRVIYSLQVGQMTQAGLLEHLKLENVSLSHQLTETQQRSIKEKERIAAQLQGIEVGPQRVALVLGFGCFLGH